MESKRIELIDISKGLGIILVVVGHCINSNSLIGLWIWSFHMPLFFIISGICFSEMKYHTFFSFFKKRVNTLLLPCLYFSILVSLISTIASGKLILKDLIFKRLPDALWFVLILFLVELLYYFLRKYCKNIIIVITIIISVCIGIILNRNGIKLSHSLCSIFVALFYYGLGNISKSLLGKLTKIKHKFLVSIIVMTIPFATVMYTNNSINLADNYIPSPEVLYILLSIIGCLGIFIISLGQFGKAKAIILYLGKNTLIILSLHMMFINIYAQYIRPYINNIIVYKSLEQIFIWVMIYSCIEFINKKASWLIGKN